MRCRAWQQGLGPGAASPALAKQRMVSVALVRTDPPPRRPWCWYLAAVPPSGGGHTNQSIPKGRVTQAGHEDLQQEGRHPCRDKLSRGTQGTCLLKL